MGTNYYLHLGKRSGNGAGNPARFNWAVPPIDAAPAVVQRCGSVMDEYGREMSLSEFMALIGEDDQRVGHVGERFS